MRTDHDFERAVRAWVALGSEQLPDPALDAALDEIAQTDQRHAGWLARRTNLMNGNALKLGLVAAAIVAVALLGVRFLPSMVGGPPDPTPIPTPTTVNLASGTFTVPITEAGVEVTIEATQTGDDVSGTATLTESFGGEGTIQLQCGRTAENGLVTVAGIVTESTWAELAEGTYYAIILEPGTPVLSTIWFDDPPSASCSEFLETIPDEHADLLPIEGDVELGP